MKTPHNRATLNPEAWGLSTESGGELCVAGHRLSDLAARYGTPLHVLDESGLESEAWEFMRAVRREFGDKASVHYAMKCNSVPEVVRILRQAGLRLEVMTPDELELALALECTSREIIVNGPCKTRAFLKRCIEAEVKLIIADSLEELADIEGVASQAGTQASVLLRVNIDYTPRGVNRGSATASRSGSPFGLDLAGGEVTQALSFCRRSNALNFRGFHFHIGTGIRDPHDYRKALRCLPTLLDSAASEQLTVEFIDVGGGFASRTTREMTSREMLLYQAIGRLPVFAPGEAGASVTEFLSEIHRGIKEGCAGSAMPHVLFEPGRVIASPHQMLLLTVHRVKERPGIGKWLLTDGGLGTVTLPTFYEYHEVFLCNDLRRPRCERVTITGPACFAGDIVYRNKWMPEVHSGEVLAIMDSGAYFTALESSFGFPRPAIVGVKRGSSRLIRRRETLGDMTGRDTLFQRHSGMEAENGICDCTI